MCRLAAFPPNFPKEAAIDVMENFFKGTRNNDGTGSAYIRGEQLVANKFPMPFDDVMKAKLPLLDHMPYNGWTIAHVRQATHGIVAVKNTHPFIKGKFAVVHNGVWTDYKLAKVCMGSVKLSGETDSEVVAALIDRVGPKRLTESARGIGVVLALSKSGCLWLSKTSGQCEISMTKHGVLIGSQLPKEYETEYIKEGWMMLDPQGRIRVRHLEGDKGTQSHTGYGHGVHEWKGHREYGQMNPEMFGEGAYD